MRKRPQQGADREQRRAGGLAALPLGPRCISSGSRALTRRQALSAHLCGCMSGLLCGKQNSASPTRGGTTQGTVPDPGLGTGSPGIVRCMMVLVLTFLSGTLTGDVS